MTYREVARKLRSLGCRELPRTGDGAHRKRIAPHPPCGLRAPSPLRGEGRGEGAVRWCSLRTLLPPCMRPRERDRLVRTEGLDQFGPENLHFLRRKIRAEQPEPEV